MSIEDEIGGEPSIAEGYRALELFTDRSALIRHFVTRVHAEPTPNTVLSLYGDGGNGKSLLLLQLQQHYARVFDRSELERVGALGDAEFARSARESSGGRPFPCVLHDFAAASGQTRGAFESLISIRRKLAGTGIRFPSFDFAALWHLYRTHRLTEDAKSLFPAEELDFVSALIDAMSHTAYGAITKAVLGLFFKHARERVLIKTRTFRLEEATIDGIQKLNPETELVDRLPYFFAEDLNASRQLPNAPARVALMFDTLEAFYAGAAGRNTRLWQRDERWFRLLLRSLDLHNGIVVVTAGRETPRWCEVEPQQQQIPAQYIDLKPVGNLAVEDARVFLLRADIHDATLAKAIITEATVAEGDVHPLYLALCADVVRTAGRQGKRLVAGDFGDATGDDVTGALVRRLLLYADADTAMAVRALATCRIFDFEIFKSLGQELDFAASVGQFEYLTSFSFIWRAGAGGGKYRVHALLRKLFAEDPDATTERAHRVLERYHRARAEPPGTGARDVGVTELTEAIYHQIFLDHDEGVEQWVNAFSEALVAGQTRQCAILLSIRTEIQSQGGLAIALVAQMEAAYFSEAGMFEQAESVYATAMSADLPDELRAYTLLGLGQVSLVRGQMSDALARLETSRALLERSAQQDAADSTVRLVLARAHSTISQIHGFEGDLAGAERSLKESVRCSQEAIALDPEAAMGKIPLAESLLSLGQLNVRMSLNTGAEQAFRECIDTCHQILASTQNPFTGILLKALALSNLGSLLELKGNAVEGLALNAEARTLGDQMLSAAPDLAGAYRVSAMLSYDAARLEMRSGNLAAARGHLAAGEKACAEVLTRAPAFIQVRRVLSDLLSLEADVAEASDTAEAIRCGEAAFAEIDRVLEASPGDMQLTLDRVGLIERQIRRLQTAGRTADATALIDAARARFEQSSQAGDRPLALTYAQGRLEEAVGGMWFAGGNLPAARTSLSRAQDLYAYYLDHGGSKWSGYREAGEVRVVLSELCLREGHVTEAETLLRAAIASFEQGAGEFPDYSSFHVVAAQALNKWAEMLVQRGAVNEAIGHYQDASAHCRKAVGISLPAGSARNANGLALRGLAIAAALQGRRDESVALSQEALAEFDLALTDGEMALCRSNKAVALTELGGVLIDLEQMDAARTRLTEAIAEATLAVSQHPGLALAVNNMSLAQTRLGELDWAAGHVNSAETWLNAALQGNAQARGLMGDAPLLASNQLLTLRLLADCAAERSDHQETRQRYLRALDVGDALIAQAPGLLVGQVNRLQAFQGAALFIGAHGSPAEAESLLKRGIAPVDTTAWKGSRVLFHLGSLYAELGDLIFRDEGRAAEAQQCYHDAVDCLAPTAQMVPVVGEQLLAYAEHRLGRCLVRRKLLDRAEAHFSEAIRLRSSLVFPREIDGLQGQNDLADTYERRANARQRQGNVAGALEDLHAATAAVDGVLAACRSKRGTDVVCNGAQVLSAAIARDISELPPRAEGPS